MDSFQPARRDFLQLLSGYVGTGWLAANWPALLSAADGPGAREAHAVYFIDRALKTYASDTLPTYQKGLEAVQKYAAESFPGVTRFSEASEEQKLQILTELSATSDLQKGVPRRGLPVGSADFLRTLRFDTICGYLVDPEGGGNRDFAGWKTIGRDPAHNFAPPFGYYDKEYPGWQAAPAETEKK